METNPHGMTPEQIIADEVKIAEIRKRNLEAQAKERATEAVAEKIKESHDYSTGEWEADKASAQEDRIARLAREQTEIDNLRGEIKG